MALMLLLTFWGLRIGARGQRREMALAVQAFLQAAAEREAAGPVILLLGNRFGEEELQELLLAERRGGQLVPDPDSHLRLPRDFALVPAETEAANPATANLATANLATAHRAVTANKTKADTAAANTLVANAATANASVMDRTKAGSAKADPTKANPADGNYLRMDRIPTTVHRATDMALVNAAPVHIPSLPGRWIALELSRGPLPFTLRLPDGTGCHFFLSENGTVLYKIH
ncbi:MAG: hypothetical protein LBT98_01430 [Puniceicoccales bacterium]|nr:hypothetical protein [Puniceicoccales bacterium]